MDIYRKQEFFRFADQIIRNAQLDLDIEGERQESHGKIEQSEFIDGASTIHMAGNSLRGEYEQ